MWWRGRQRRADWPATPPPLGQSQGPPSSLLSGPGRPPTWFSRFCYNGSSRGLDVCSLRLTGRLGRSLRCVATSVLAPASSFCPHSLSARASAPPACSTTSASSGSTPVSSTLFRRYQILFRYYRYIIVSLRLISVTTMCARSSKEPCPYKAIKDSKARVACTPND